MGRSPKGVVKYSRLCIVVWGYRCFPAPTFTCKSVSCMRTGGITERLRMSVPDCFGWLEATCMPARLDNQTGL